MIKQIAIIEDNSELVEFIKEYLNQTGEFHVKGYTSGADALKQVKLNRPDLAIIDLQLGDIRGETICTELRKVFPDLPIIILTGDKSPASIINSLNAGADDYVTKPFNADELVARINARLRNVNLVPHDKVLAAQELTVNLETLEVKIGDRKVDLTAKEFELLKYLLLNKACILTREKILSAVWGYSSLVDTRVVDVHVGKLRKKIEDAGKPDLVKTVRGFGYKIVD